MSEVNSARMAHFNSADYKPPRCNRQCVRSRVAGSRITEEADVPSEGEMEGGAAGQASGNVHSGNGKGVGNSQEHGEKIHRCCEPTGAAGPDRINNRSI